MIINWPQRYQESWLETNVIAEKPKWSILIELKCLLICITCQYLFLILFPFNIFLSLCFFLFFPSFLKPQLKMTAKQTMLNQFLWPWLINLKTPGQWCRFRCHSGTMKDLILSLVKKLPIFSYGLVWHVDLRRSTIHASDVDKWIPKFCRPNFKKQAMNFLVIKYT